jgi:hypothetical protein
MIRCGGWLAYDIWARGGETECQFDASTRFNLGYSRRSLTDGRNRRHNRFDIPEAEYRTAEYTPDYDDLPSKNSFPL